MTVLPVLVVLETIELLLKLAIDPLGLESDQEKDPPSAPAAVTTALDAASVNVDGSAMPAL